METIYKTCRKCGQSKPIEELAKHKKCTFGVQALCKKCEAKRTAKLDPEKERIRKRLVAKKWREKNPLARRIRVLNYLAKKYGAIGKFTILDIREKFISQKNQCVWCKKDISKHFHIDHIVPLFRGGTNWPENIAITCPRCNDRKGRLMPNEFVKKIRRERIP